MARITDFVSPRIAAGAQQDIWARQLFFSHIGTANVHRVDDYGLEVSAEIDTHAFELPEHEKRDHSFVLELDPDPDAAEGPARLTIDGVPAREATFQVKDNRLVVQAKFYGDSAQAISIERSRRDDRETHLSLWGKYKLFVRAAAACRPAPAALPAAPIAAKTRGLPSNCTATRPLRLVA